MSKEKQIEEMAKILSSNCGDCSQCSCYKKDINGVDACYFKYAEMIYNAGYRKQSEVARGIFADIKKAIKEEVLDYCKGFESMETREMQEYFKTKQNTAIYLYMKIDHIEKKYTEGEK